MPVGTQASVKGLSSEVLAETGAQCILANTYHLHLRPGEAVIQRLGGLHRFMNWSGSILTDSGGFQVFSLADLRDIDDHGVRFKSHLDGSEVELTPHRATQIQNALGADMFMAFDHCPASTADRATISLAVERSVRWASICRAAHRRPGEQALFGIVQGGLDLDLRLDCLRELVGLDLPGYAVGGLAVGESHEQMVEVLGGLVPRMPTDKPRYLMGVGTLRDIAAAVATGIDMFDCVMPTRNGRNATAFTDEGTLKLRNARFRDDPAPLHAGSTFAASGAYSRAYLRHLFLAKEMLGPQLVSAHNVWYYQRSLAMMRQAIEQGTFADWLHSARQAAAEHSLLADSEDSTV